MEGSHAHHLLKQNLAILLLVQAIVKLVSGDHGLHVVLVVEVVQEQGHVQF